VAHSRRIVGLFTATAVVCSGAVAIAGDTVTCSGQKQPVEAQTLHFTFVRDPLPRRAGEQVRLRMRVTRAVRPGSPLSPVTEALPIAFASVAGDVRAKGRTLDSASNETDGDGWVTLVFNLPAATPAGPVAIDANVRYATVGSQTCEEPYVVETGRGLDDAVVTVRKV